MQIESFSRLGSRNEHAADAERVMILLVACKAQHKLPVV